MKFTAENIDQLKDRECYWVLQIGSAWEIGRYNGDERKFRFFNGSEISYPSSLITEIDVNPIVRK